MTPLLLEPGSSDPRGPCSSQRHPVGPDPGAVVPGRAPNFNLHLDDHRPIAAAHGRYQLISLKQRPGFVSPHRHHHPQQNSQDSVATLSPFSSSPLTDLSQLPSQDESFVYFWLRVRGSSDHFPSSAHWCCFKLRVYQRLIWKNGRVWGRASITGLKGLFSPWAPSPLMNPR